jgi:signal transduction histidine kinase/CheY-like chemotaxis protein
MHVVLVIAEERAIREAISASLRDTCHTVFESEVDAALRRLISIHADAIILDDTPKLGLTALTRVAKATPHLPIIALSARGDSETRAGFTLAGAAACLPKPFSYDDVISAMNHVIGPQESPPEPVHVEGNEPSNTAIVSQYQTAMRWLNRFMSSMEDTSRLEYVLADALVDVFDPSRCAVLLDRDGAVRVAASHGIAPGVAQMLRLEYASGLMRWFEVNPYLIDKVSARSTSAAKELHLLGARLGVPVLCSGRVTGALVIGDKASGREYGTEERELLTTLARAAGTALENAELHRDLAGQQGHLNTVLEHLASGVVVIGVDKTVRMLNQSAERILQIRAVDLVGRSVQKLGSGFADVVLRVLMHRKPLLRQEIRDAAIDATLGLSAAPLGEDGVVVIFSALPKQHQAKDDIEYSPYWEYLSARVAQEIKNPLVAINTFAQLLPRKYESEDFREQFGQVMQTEVERINRVVETLFDFARHPRLMPQSSNVNEVVSNVLDTFEEEGRSRGITIERKLDTGLPTTNLDPLFFAQAIHNIVQNAFDAMPNGGKLKVASRSRDENSEILIADTGPGIPEQVAPLVFLPFFGTREHGMGLGLTVASRIVRQHQGELKLLASESGSVFAVRVPRAGAVATAPERTERTKQDQKVSLTSGIV